ncbi:3-hydroxyacyl-CoA dehydrogenase NAD-binding domain-containing protein [Oligoflexia bacterium]|nr:3-hydroxyacyl-CoA dehydrogenase NAD-binding domain-containing protein [Oligoflexia bacterium]
MSTIKTIGIVGAGQMGAGIAQVSALSGFETILWDANAAGLEKGMGTIKKRLERQVEKENITTQAMDAALKLTRKAGSLSDFSSCDLAIEAIIENAAAKQELFKQLDDAVPPAGILATNTSSISITKIAAATKRPEKVVGVHFMNPVPLMELVELIRGLQTADDTYNTICDVVKRMGKTAVLAMDGPGFIVNRILCPMINEAIFLLQEGCKAEDIDAGMKLGTNHPMGPLELADFVGLETLLYILQVLHKELGEDKYRPCPLLVKYVEAGWYGKKSGRGFYEY